MTESEIEVHRGRLEQALYFARRSTIRTFKTGAVIYAPDGNLVSTGWSHYTELLRLQRFRSIHAEVHAIFRAPPQLLEGSRIYIANIRGKSGNVGLAKPCLPCLSYLADVGVWEAYYTVEGAEWTRYVVSEIFRREAREN